MDHLDITIIILVESISQWYPTTSCSQSQSALALTTSSPRFKGYIHHHHHHHHHCHPHHYHHHINHYHLHDNSKWKDTMSQYQLKTTLFCRSILLSQMAWFTPATSKGSLKVISTDLKSNISFKSYSFSKLFRRKTLSVILQKIFSLQSITKPFNLKQNYSLLRDAPF